MNSLKSSIILIVFSFTFTQFNPDNVGISASFGSVTIDNEVYNQIALRPEIPIGNFGLGLDLYFYINGDGEFYKENWDFSSTKAGYRTIMDKIYYARWGKPTDPIYVRAGSLLHSTLGNGILVNAYSNAMEYPQIKRIGLDVKAQAAGLGFEYIQSDFKRTPGIMALRVSGAVMPGMSAGFSIVTDQNQNAGLGDRDEDGYPDVFDHYPDEEGMFDEAQESKDSWYPIWESSVDTASVGFDDWFLSLPLNHNTFNTSTYSIDAVSGYSFDLVYALSKNISLYAQFAQLLGETADHGDNYKNNLGQGYVPIGMQAKLGPLNVKAEYRSNSRNFLFNYWDRSYDVTRVIYSDGQIITRESQLYRYGRMSGLYTEMHSSLFNVITLGAGYQDLVGEQWDDEEMKYIEDSNRSLKAMMELNTSIVPKLKKAQLFYMQNNVKNPFDFDATPSTVYGFDLSLQMNSSMMLVYKSRTTFVDTGNGVEPVNSAQFETQILFN